MLVHYGACPSGPRYKRLEREAAAAGAGTSAGKRRERSAPHSPSRAPAPKAAAKATKPGQREPDPAQAGIRQFFGKR